MKKKKRLAFYIFMLVALLVVIMIVITSFLSRAHENPTVDELAGAVQRTESLIKIVSGEATLSAQNPYIQHTRKAFNGYLDGTNTGISDPVSAQLSAVDTDYLKSKFVPLSIADNTTGGGKQINILFVDKLDAVFWV